MLHELHYAEVESEIDSLIIPELTWQGLLWDSIT